MQSENLEYVGFWPRMGATLIDVLLQLAITSPLTYAVYGRYSNGFHFMGKADVLINLILPAVVVVAFWVYFGATPGKMALSAKVVDADTGEPLAPAMSFIRYLGYFLSFIPLCVGFLWIGFDRRSQGWHDKLANSVVIRPTGKAKVHFEGKRDWRIPASERAEKSEPRF